jgi:uncharacterized UPF0160 family protein
MTIVVATHSGPFHADDVLSWALIRHFLSPEATLIRTRDKDVLAQADLVFDVGGSFDPATRRFDHHQSSYEGPLSSAGMVLNWLEAEEKVSPLLAKKLREQLVDYVDDVDNGRVAPKKNIPCFPKIVEAMNQPATTEEDFDEAFRLAGVMAIQYLQGVDAGHRQVLEAERVVRAAMEKAEAEGSNVICFDAYYRWKDIYFDAGGSTHPTEFVLFPGTDQTWRLVAIPPERGSFDQKKALPETWAGLSDGALEAVTGVEGCMFCHKNRFIAVFDTRETALTVMQKFGISTSTLRP